MIGERQKHPDARDSLLRRSSPEPVTLGRREWVSSPPPDWCYGHWTRKLIPGTRDDNVGLGWINIIKRSIYSYVYIGHSKISHLNVRVYYTIFRILYRFGRKSRGMIYCTGKDWKFYFPTISEELLFGNSFGIEVHRRSVRWIWILCRPSSPNKVSAWSWLG